MKAKVITKSTNKRDLVTELGEGIAALADAREGKRTQGRAKPNAQAALLIN